MSDDRFTIVRSEDDQEMAATPGLRAVRCRCGWRSVWVGDGTLYVDQYDEGHEATADEHAALMVEVLNQSERHADH